MEKESIIKLYEETLDEATRDESKEAVLQEFLEKYLFLLPELNGLYNAHHHGAHCSMVFPQYPISGTFKRIPDFMFITTNSVEAKIVFIEIERPSKNIFTQNNEFTSEFNHAYSQLEDWYSWMAEGINKSSLIRDLCLAFNSNRIQDLSIKSQYILIYGRRNEFADNPLRRRKMSTKNRAPFSVMSFDRLEPYSNQNYLLPIRKKADGSFYASNIPQDYEYNQAKSAIHRHIDKIETVKKSTILSEERKTNLIKEMVFWDAFDDPIESALAQINRNKMN